MQSLELRSNCVDNGKPLESFEKESNRIQLLFDNSLTSGGLQEGCQEQNGEPELCRVSHSCVASGQCLPVSGLQLSI